MRSQSGDRITRLANHFADALTQVIAAALDGRPIRQPRKRPRREVPEKKRPPARQAVPVKAKAPPKEPPRPAPAPKAAAPKAAAKPPVVVAKPPVIAVDAVPGGALGKRPPATPAKLLAGTPAKSNGVAHGHDPWDLNGFKALGRSDGTA